MYLTIADAIDLEQRSRISRALGELAASTEVDAVPYHLLHVTIQMATGLWVHEVPRPALGRFNQAMSGIAVRTAPFELGFQSSASTDHSISCLCTPKPAGALHALRLAVTQAMLDHLGDQTDRYIGGPPHMTLAYANTECRGIEVPTLRLHSVRISSMVVAAGTHHPLRNLVVWRVLSRHRFAPGALSEFKLGMPRS